MTLCDSVSYINGNPAVILTVVKVQNIACDTDSVIWPESQASPKSQFISSHLYLPLFYTGKQSLSD